MTPFNGFNSTSEETSFSSNTSLSGLGSRSSRVQVGPSDTELKILIVVNGICSAIGILGNLLVCLVVVKFRFLGRPKAELFIASLAIADFLVCATVQPMYVIHLHGVLPNLLNVIRKTVTWILTLVSVSHLLSISIERFLTLYFLHRYSVWVPTWVIWSAIAITWVIAVSLGAPTGTSLNARYVAQYFVITVLVVIPALYAGTFYIVRLQRKRFEKPEVRNASSPQKNFARERKTFFMIAIVVGVFFICYTPLTVLPFFFTIGAPPSVLVNVRRAFPWINTLALSNSSLNPYVYYWRSLRFRLATETIARRLVERR